MSKFDALKKKVGEIAVGLFSGFGLAWQNPRCNGAARRRGLLLRLVVARNFSPDEHRT